MKLAEEKKPMILIPLDIPHVRVLETEVTSSGDFLITVESTLGSTTCGKCGRETAEFHCYDRWITLRHLPILDRKVFIRLRPKRYRCRYCSNKPTTTQRLSWYEPGSSNTKAYEQYLLLRLVNSTIEDVSGKEHVGYEAVSGIIDRYLSQEVNWEEYESIEALGLDEIALKKGHQDFVVIATARQRDARVRVLAMLGDRKKETVKQFLQGIPARLISRIESVCTDMYDGFIKELSKQEYEEIKGAMWPLRKRPEDLKEQEAQVLKRLFERSESLCQAYNLREELTEIFEQELTKADAKEKINQWREDVRQSGLSCFNPFLTMLDNWMDEITNYFLKRETSGFVEGINNKIKVLKRRCYGIFNLGHLFQRLFLDLEGYRLYAKTAS